MYEFNRSAPACRDGVLREGLVDIYRRPNMCAKLYKELFAEIKNPRKPECKLTVCDAVNKAGNYTPIEISLLTDSPEQKEAFDNMMRIAEQPIPRYYHNGHKLRIMKSGPVLPEGISKIGALPVSLSSRPVIADAERSVEIEIGKNVEKLYLVGAVSMPEGFPIGGQYGEVAAVLISFGTADILFCVPNGEANLPNIKKLLKKIFACCKIYSERSGAYEMYHGDR